MPASGTRNIDIGEGIGSEGDLKNCRRGNKETVSDKTRENLKVTYSLKDPSQPPPFSVPSKLKNLHDEVKSLDQYQYLGNYAPTPPLTQR